MRSTDPVHRQQWVGEALLAAILALIICYLILHFGEGRAPLPNMDQGFVYIDPWPHRKNGHWIFQYPHLEYAGGITATFLVALYKLIIPTHDSTLNHHVKLFAAFLYLVSNVFLIREYLTSALNRIYALAIIGSAGLVLLEPSSEVIAAVYLNVFLIAIARNSHIVAAISVALFSLTKAEMVPIAVAIAGSYSLLARCSLQQKIVFVLIFATATLALVVPAWLLYGAPGSRSLPAIELTYCEWYGLDVEACSAGKFISINSLVELIWSRPRHYVAFLLWRLPDISGTVVNVLGPIIIALPILIWFGWKRLSAPKETIFVVVVTVTLVASIAVGLAVGLMMPRYLTRVYGATIVACLLCWETISSNLMAANSRRAAFASAFVIGMLFLNIWRLPMYIFAPHGN